MFYQFVILSVLACCTSVRSPGTIKKKKKQKQEEACLFWGLFVLFREVFFFKGNRLKKKKRWKNKAWWEVEANGRTSGPFLWWCWWQSNGFSVPFFVTRSVVNVVAVSVLMLILVVLARKKMVGPSPFPFFLLPYPLPLHSHANILDFTSKAHEIKDSPFK